MSDADPSEPASLLDRALRLFSEVRAGEGATVLLMTANVFVVMFSYYVIKVARESLILAVDGGAELKSYASGVMAAALVLILPGYNWLISRVSTKILLFGVVGFFLICTEGFYFAWKAGLGIELLFFAWVGIFSLFTVALFWSFANEIYARGDGERLFPVIGIGMTAGPVVGSLLAERLFAEKLSTGAVLQVAAGLLVVHGVIYAVVLRRPDVTRGLKRERGGDEDEARRGVKAAAEGFLFLFQNRYIGVIAVLILLLNLVNTTGEYILSKYVVGLAEEALTAAGDVDDAGAWKKNYIGAFYGDFFFWVNLLGVALQAFVASRLVKIFGIAGVLFALPLVAGGAYALAAAGVSFAVFRWAKTAENSTDYSIMNTARAMLWLPTTRDEKYKGKGTTDTLVVRSGDMLSAGFVFVGTTTLSLGPRGFALINVVLVSLWLLIALYLTRQYRRLAAERGVDERQATKG